MGIGWSEMFVIVVVTLLLFGPKELPQAARSLARFLRQMRTMWGDAQRVFNEALRDVEREIDLEEHMRTADSRQETAASEEPARTAQPETPESGHTSSNSAPKRNPTSTEKAGAHET